MFKPGAIFKQFDIKCLNRILFSRCYATHWDPKFKKIRRDKIVEMKFPDFEKVKKNNMFKMTAEENFYMIDDNCFHICIDIETSLLFKTLY